MKVQISKIINRTIEISNNKLVAKQIFRKHTIIKLINHRKTYITSYNYHTKPCHNIHI